MQSTGLFAELLLGGIQASIWVLLILSTVIDVSALKTKLIGLDKWATVLLPPFLGAWYTLGVVCDRIANLVDVLIRPKVRLLRFKWFKHRVD